MALFLSTYENRIDRKWRVSVPASYRLQLAQQSFQGIVAVRWDEYPALRCTGIDAMEQIGAARNTRAIFQRQADRSPDERGDLDLAASAQLLPFDGEGRIVLPRDLVAHVGVGELALFAGRLNYFEIWSPEAYRRRAGTAAS